MIKLATVQFNGNYTFFSSVFQECSSEERDVKPLARYA